MTAPMATGIAAPSILQPIAPDVYGVLFAPNTGARTLDLSDQEKLIMTQLAGRLMDGRYQYDLRLSNLYYLGQNIVPSLGISVPPELEMLRAILGWCAGGIDARSERLNVQGFRMANQTTVDDTLHEVWEANRFEAESKLVHDDAMITGRSFVIVGPGDDGTPLLTPESSTNMIGSWDVRNRCLSAAYQSYLDVDPASETYLQQLATLYTRNATIQLVNQPGKGWLTQDRNDHNMGVVPVVMFAPWPAIHNRLGNSLMTAAWRNTQDRACRTLQRAEITGEFFAAPKTWLLGATEQAFQGPDGSPKSAWETFIGRISALEADPNGNLPQVTTTPGSNPDGMISTLDHLTRLMAGHTGLPPQYLGIFNDGNPSSADAIRMSDFRLKTICDRLTVVFGHSWEQVMRLAMMVDGNKTADQLPPDTSLMETDWDYTGIATPNADAVTVTTQIAAEMIAPTSDDALAYCGWSPVQRARIQADLKKWQGLQTIHQAIGGLQRPGTGQQAGQPMDGSQPQAVNSMQVSAESQLGRVGGASGFGDIAG
ncbi:phage portal protein [Mycobacterium malmoense]|uniref:phage portal protein n=1 Tax=Mycobacterium malmoense TaxID=1780 RepID=UPI0009FAAFC5|nr:phage portal protein [Mycobacterium malmoense]